MPSLLTSLSSAVGKLRLAAHQHELDVVVVSYGETGSAARRSAEGAAIHKAFAGSGTRVVECEASELDATLEAEWKKRRKMIVHLVGHHCSLGDARRNLPCEVVSLVPVSSKLGELQSAKVGVKSSLSDLVDVLRKRKVDLVFANASHTSKLADRLDSRAFGWRSACVEEGAVMLAALFYHILSRGANIDDAFTLAQERLARGRQKVPKFRLVDPTDEDAIREAMPGRLLSHQSSSAFELQSSDVDCPDGAPTRRLDAAYDDDSWTKRFRSSSGTSSSTSTILEAREPSWSVLASLQADFTRVDASTQKDFHDNDVLSSSGDISPTDSLIDSLRFFIDDQQVELDANTALPCGVPYMNDGAFHFEDLVLEEEEEEQEREEEPERPVLARRGFARPFPQVPQRPPPPAPVTRFPRQRHFAQQLHQAPPRSRSNSSERSAATRVTTDLSPPARRFAVPAKTSNEYHVPAVLMDEPRAAPPPAAPAPVAELTDLQGIGVAKATKLKRQGIHTVEALACVDVNNIELAKACTGNKRYDEAMDTLTRWRNAARANLQTRTAHVRIDNLAAPRSVTPPRSVAAA